MPRSGPSDLALYFQHRLREAVKAGREAQDIAREADLSPGQISGLMNHAKGFGFRTFEGMLAVFGLTESQARDAATAFVVAHPEVRHGRRASQESVVVPDITDRYPARADALAAARLLRLDPEAIASVASWDLRGGETMTRDEWLDEIRREARRLQRERLMTPDAKADAGREAEREFDEVVKREQAAEAVAKAARDAIKAKARKK